MCELIWDSNEKNNFDISYSATDTEWIDIKYHKMSLFGRDYFNIAPLHGHCKGNRVLHIDLMVRGTNIVWLTHWGRDKMDAISQMTFSSDFSWMKMF